MNSGSLTIDRLKELLHYDQDTGVFTWNVRRSGKTPAGSVAGSSLAGDDGGSRAWSED